MRNAMVSMLTQFCWRSRLLYSLQRVAKEAQLRRGKIGQWAFPYISKRRLPNFQILTFHRLTRQRDPFFPGLPVEVFARQVEFLAGNYTLVDLAELIRQLERGKSIPKNAVVLTFDDGYRDNYELAFPVLRRYQIPATIFLTTAFVSEQDILWNDKVCFALKHTKCTEMTVNCDGERHFWLHTIEQRLAAAKEMLWYLFHIAHTHKLAFIDQLLTQLDIHDFGELWESMLTWGQIRHMKQNGVNFGAHTVTHPVLSRLPLEQAREEVQRSKRDIEREIDGPVDLFAYPVGRPLDFNEDLKTLVRELGFKAAVTTVFGTNTAETDRYALHRVGPDEEDLAVFASKQCWYKFSM
ncbi:MAG TPA: polysaccharide deacetylase family protein [Nitrososphaera sp.]|nr:polysaccharide deacetylase family protein [Nitrososphaera sp.]